MMEEQRGVVVRMLVFADSHGNRNGVIDAAAGNLPLNAIVHLGDGIDDGKAAAEKLGVEFYGVAGNEDRSSEFPEKHLLVHEAFSILMIHGHQTDINPYQDASTREKHYRKMAAMASEAGAGLLLFGHTHHAEVLEVDDVVLFNPGNMYIGSAATHSFGIIEIDKDGVDVSISARNGDGRWEEIRRLSCCQHRCGA
ncbi:MAG: YfcE family phosphodiesterase [Spirochaetales bacterium]|nr:MAG: YfcE family phosphodiesterase [Spirochaetales bacterium]